MTEFISKADISATSTMSSRAAAKALGVGKTSVNKYRREYGVQPPSKGITDPDEPQVRKPRILALDLETSPNLAHVWGLWQQNVGINQLLESTEVICFGARWLGEDNVVVYSQFKDGKQGMLAAAWKLLNEADAVMGWNSKGFDMKHLNREFIENGFTPPSPTKQLDLMLEVKKHFRFPSNKLDYVAQALGFEGKVKHEGHTLWIKCMAGDAEAWERMYEYQVQDVDLLIDIYGKVQPWLKGHPNMGLFSGESTVCTNCGSADLQRHGEEFSSTGVYARYQCKGCGHWNRSYKRESTTEMRTL